MAEKWDLYDIERVKTGETIERGNPLPPNRYHLVIHVCVFGSDGRMLIQQRQPFKEGWSNMWDVTVGGSAVAGDTSQTAAEREVLEEIGLPLSLDGERPRLSINFDVGFDDIWCVNRDVDISSLKLQYEEVQAVKWATKEEILAMIDSGEFI
ncbi:MAG: NUDIX domain-containing protein, partial [Ruminococcaceae bacterium]|nr:NUDIX domain-containing protein [Oscillospiraceae bacterium]